LSLLVAPWPEIARAGDRSEVTLSLVAPAHSDCLTAEALRRAVQERVGPVVLEESRRAETRVDVRITAQKRGYVASIRASDAGGRSLGERALATSSEAAPGTCAALERPLVFVISTLIGKTSGPMGRESAEPVSVAVPPGEPGAPAAPGVPPAADVLAAVTQQTASAPGPRVRFGLALGGGIQTGLVPGVAPSATARFLMSRGALRLRLGLGTVPWAERDLGGSARATFRSAFADLDLCALAALAPRAALALCAGVIAGGVHAETTGLYQNAAVLRPFVRCAASVSLELPITKMQALSVEAGGTLPLLSGAYVFSETGEHIRDIHGAQAGLLAEVAWVVHFSS
jgi:hypothetical protein